MERRRSWLSLVLVGLVACGDGGDGYEYEESIRPAEARPDRRAGYTATPLLDGRILIAGGVLGELGERVYPTDLWLFDPETAGFERVKGELGTGRSGHFAALQPDGRVVIAGGFHFDSPPDGDVLSVEVYDPATDSVALGGEALAPAWDIAALPGGDLVGFNFSYEQEDELVIQRYLVEEERWVRLAGEPANRYHYVRVLGLAGGEVLVLGAAAAFGHEGFLGTDGFEYYDPAAGRFHGRDSLSGRGSHDYIDSAVALADGRVLVLTSSAFLPPTRGLYLVDPEAGDVEPLDAEPLPLVGVAVAPLLDGRALLVGGQSWADDDVGESLRELRIFAPADRSLTLLPAELSFATSVPTLAVSRRGPVMIAGGDEVDLFE